jgi:uncharacterized protein (TIGR02246 family)
MEAIQKVFDTYASARVAGDASLWLSIWDEEGIQMSPGIRARGKDVLKMVIPPSFIPGSVLSFTIDMDEIAVLGEFAFAHGHYVSDRIVDGAAVRIDGKFLTILRRQADGAWKIYRDCSNSNLP